MLVGTFAFANIVDENETQKSKKTESETIFYQLEIENLDGTCSVYYFVYDENGDFITEFELISLDTNPDCGGVVFYML